MNNNLGSFTPNQSPHSNFGASPNSPFNQAVSPAQSASPAQNASFLGPASPSQNSQAGSTLIPQNQQQPRVEAVTYTCDRNSKPTQGLLEIISFLLLNDLTNLKYTHY